ncbi:MAG: class I adenylate-forming enzyme family protein [Thermodesulfobacteriota bacterium]|jgi:long-chain acyl-CoA synthetase
MLIKDFSLENVEVGGYSIQTFKNRFRNLWEMFFQSTITYKNEIYVIEGQKRITFGQAAELAIGLAAQIKAKTGAGQGDHIGILMENSIRFVIAFWATQSLGATAVIFNTRLAAPELKRQLQFSDLKVLLSSSVLSVKVQEIPSENLNFQQVVLGNDCLADLPRGIQTRSPSGVCEDDTAFILFTSGTSGTPKGVMLTHRNLITCAIRSGAVIAQGLALAASEGFTIQQPSKEQYMVIVAPLFHIMAIEQMAAAVFLGRGSILLPSFNPQEIMDFINRGKIFGLTGTPTMYWLLLHKTAIRGSKVDSIRSLGFGAAPMAPDLLKELKEVFPSARRRNGYGMTEAPSISALPDLYMESHPTSVGKPNLCTEVKIVDPLTRKEMGPNEVGELAVRGALVSKGYYKAPEETAKVYQQGWFYSGDMAYQDKDGFLYLVGRSREMINRGGENVYPVEVENVLHLHLKILDVAVFGLPDPVMGSIVACAVVPRPGTERITLEEIQEFCRDQLASYKIPQKVFFLREMPTNPGGKVMKNKLVEQFN